MAALLREAQYHYSEDYQTWDLEEADFQTLPPDVADSQIGLHVVADFRIWRSAVAGYRMRDPSVEDCKEWGRREEHTVGSVGDSLVGGSAWRKGSRSADSAEEQTWVRRCTLSVSLLPHSHPVLAWGRGSGVSRGTRRGYYENHHGTSADSRPRSQTRGREVRVCVFSEVSWVPLHRRHLDW